MRLSVKNRRGVTLAELMVTLAMVAILAVMAVSFTLLLTEQTRANSDHLAFQQEFTQVKSVVEGWMSAAAKEHLEVDLVDPGDPVALKAGAKTLQFRNGVLSGEGISLRMESIDTVTFRLEGKMGKEYLLFCTVTQTDGTEKYTFCVNARLGELRGGL